MGTGEETPLPSDAGQFVERLHTELEQLQRAMARPGFGAGPISLGAELEISLIDTLGQSLPINHRVLDAALDPRVAVELDRFNLEFNAAPVPMERRPFTAIGDEIFQALGSLGTVAAVHGGRVIPIGILPTLRLDDLQSGAMSDHPRYRLMSASLREERIGPFVVNIDGREPLEVECEDVTLEGAATSLQMHVRVEPRDFANVYNAAQLATAPAVALAGNSPTFLGHRLWEETRIALFKQAVDARNEPSADGWPPARVSFGHGWVREGAFELFAESVALYRPLVPTLFPETDEPGNGPSIPELRQHHGSVWRWNRAVYDPIYGGHLRIEFRSLPSGPSVVDMMANAAFLIGLSFGLAPVVRRRITGLPFAQAHRNFYRAAQYGLDAELLWPSGRDQQPKFHKARELIPQLIPVARSGLLSVGVDRDEADQLLGIVGERVESGMTGSRWQRDMLDALMARVSREEALVGMVERYLGFSKTNTPVHSWPVEV